MNSQGALKDAIKELREEHYSAPFDIMEMVFFSLQYPPGHFVVSKDDLINNHKQLKEQIFGMVLELMVVGLKWKENNRKEELKNER